MLKTAILISGSGTTLQNLIDLSAQGALDINIVGVISSKPAVKGLKRAENHQLPAAVVDHKQYKKRAAAFSNAITAILQTWQPDLIVMAGFIHLYQVPTQYENRIINIHPALLPKHGGKGMYGLHVHQAVLDSGDTETGCTVHYVDNQYDSGPIVLQRNVTIDKNDTAESLQAKVQTEERIALPEAIRQFYKTLTS